jgi:hypothetical protein
MRRRPAIGRAAPSEPLPALTTALVDVAQGLRRRLKARADAALRGEAAVSGRT